MYFSVITPSWNQGKFLRGCIGSVADQNDPDFEHLIFDNCSTDGTAEIVAGFPHVKFVSEPDRGQSHAVNKGLSLSCGEIICWLNSDDEYAPGAFEALREVFSDPAVRVVFGDVRQIGYDGRGEEVVRGRFEARLDFVRWWSSRIKLHQPAIFFRREAGMKFGPLREDLHYAMDYELWWRMSESIPFHYIPQVLAIQHRQPDSKTVSSWGKVYEERRRVFEPFYGLIDGGNPGALARECRRAMADNHLKLAWSSPQGSGCLLANLLMAWREDWTRVARPETLGLFRRLFLAHKSHKSKGCP